MLDIDIEDDLTKNQNSYDGLISTIEVGQGTLVLIIASCTARTFQAESIDRYEAELAPSIPCYRVKLDRSEPSLRQALEDLVDRHPELQVPKANAVITATGAADLLSFKLGESEANSALDRFFGYLQWTREGLREFPFPIVLWVTPQILTQLSSKAPDFWSWRGGVFRFAAPAFVSDRTNFTPTIDSSFKPESASDLPIDELLEQVAQISAKNPNSATLSTLFDRLGQAYTDRLGGNGAENRATAIEYFQRALAIQGKLGLNRFNTLVRLANLYRRLSNWNEAESLDLECLKIQTESGDRAGMATSWGVLGDIQRNRGNYDAAEALYQQSLAMRTELGDRAGMASSWGCLGDIARDRGDYDKAEALYSQSLTVLTELGDRAGMATSWGSLGENELGRGNLDAAETWLKKALTVMKDIQMTDYIAEVNWCLAQIYRAKGDEPLAQQHYSIAHDLFIKLGAKGELERIEKEWL